jgi:hypothetical protein
VSGWVGGCGCWRLFDVFFLLSFSIFQSYIELRLGKPVEIVDRAVSLLHSTLQHWTHSGLVCLFVLLRNLRQAPSLSVALPPPLSLPPSLSLSREFNTRMCVRVCVFACVFCLFRVSTESICPYQWIVSSAIKVIRSVERLAGNVFHESECLLACMFACPSVCESVCLYACLPVCLRFRTSFLGLP